MYQVIKNYRDNEQLRHSFNELAKKTFWIDFEDWYQNGYWTDRYNPYSIVIDDKVVANVSVNTTTFENNGTQKRYIQLGTVMTEEAYRNQGLIRLIMEEIEKDNAEKVDGMYLFANNEVLSFYPKFGFRTAKQYEYVLNLQEQVQNTRQNMQQQTTSALEDMHEVREVIAERRQEICAYDMENTVELFTRIPMKNKKCWDMLECKIKTGYQYSAFEMLDNTQLNMFYVSKYMQDNVFYSEELETYVIAEIEDDTLIINMVISDKEQDLVQIAKGFGKDIRQVILGFTPKKAQGFEVREMDQDDRTLHVKGDLGMVEQEKLMFPLLAHA